jgi:hypothetical protein
MRTGIDPIERYAMLKKKALKALVGQKEIL